MKRILLLTALLTLLLMGGAPVPIRLVRLTIVNKSGLKIEVELTGSCYDDNEDYHYYLRVPKGDRQFPVEKVFTILPDMYTMSVYYVELWDPVYGTKCSGSGNLTVDATRNVRVIVSECTWTPPNAGEPSMLKYGGAGRRRGR